MKVVINKCYGGFGLSDKGMETYQEFCRADGKQPKEYYWEIVRNDPALVRTVETLGKEVNDSVSRLKVVEIPDGINWFVQEGAGGVEWVAEIHRVWD